MIIKKNVPVSKLSSFGNVGEVPILYIAETISELQELIQKFNRYIVIGKGSNTIINPNHSYEAIIQLSSTMFAPKINQSSCTFGAATSIHDCLKFCFQHQLSGLEFAIGIPASIGGMTFMNFSCWDQSMEDIVKTVYCLMPNGEIQTIHKKDLDFSYRYSCFQKNKAIILQVELNLQKTNKENIKNKKAYYLSLRKKHHPFCEKSFGSIYKNQLNTSSGKLLEQLGLKGKKMHNIVLSKQHANFMINQNNASFQNVLDALNFIEKLAKDKKNITLQREVRLLN